MMNRSLFTLLALGLICDVVNANPAPIKTCIKDMSRVYRNEQLVTDTSIRRTYILCPNTVFSPGIANPETGVITGGQEPLACKSNCLIKCGNNGSSANKCIIDGTGTFGIFQIPYNLFKNRPKVTKDVTYQGITIDFFVSAYQIPVLAASFFGDVTFDDCVWSNNSADPAFILSELKLAATSRSAVIEPPPETPKKLPGFAWKQPVKDVNLGRHLVEKDVESVDRPIIHDNNLSTTGRRQLRASDLLQDEDTEVTTVGNRVLQTTGNFEVTFKGCFFDFNDPVRNADSQGGLSLIRFTNGLVNENDDTVKDRLGGLHATIIGTKFNDNVFNFNNDIAGYRSLIDFFSLGTLTMKDNCFLKSPVKNYGVVTVQQGATIVNTNNFVEKEQPSLKCDFIALLNIDYNVVGCGRVASGTKCGGDFCFPGDATCQVEGKGTVLMRNVELGDKVLIQGGKYEHVYSFGHRDRDVMSRYLKLVTSGSSLEVSPNHLVFVEGGRAVPASSVKVGDKLQLADGKLASVESIEVLTKQGAYAPFTASGTVVVNGVTASSFVSLQGSTNFKIGSIDTGLSYHVIGHAFETPHRFWCRYVSACSEESYTPDGMSLWVAGPHMFARWYLEQQMVIMVLLGAPLIALLLCMAHPFTAIMTLAGILLGCRHRSLRCKAL